MFSIINWPLFPLTNSEIELLLRAKESLKHRHYYYFLCDVLDCISDSSEVEIVESIHNKIETAIGQYSLFTYFCESGIEFFDFSNNRWASNQDYQLRIEWIDKLLEHNGYHHD